VEIEFYVLCVCYAYKLLLLAQELPFTCPILFSKAISDNFKNNGSSTWNFEPNSEKFALACRSSKVAAIFDPLSHAGQQRIAFISRPPTRFCRNQEQEV